MKQEWVSLMTDQCPDFKGQAKITWRFDEDLDENIIFSQAGWYNRESQEQTSSAHFH